MSGSARLLVLLALTSTMPRPLFSSSQDGDTTARISGKAMSAYNGAPLAGVMISVPAAQRFVVTDSTGVFLLVGLPGGAQKVRISYAGRGAEEFEVALRGGRTQKLALLLDIGAVDLAPVIVTARYPLSWRNLAGFYERKRWYSGFAHFFTREDIEQADAQTISALLVPAGIMIRCWDECVPMRFSRGRICVVPVSVDGMPFWEYDFDRIAIHEIAGVEVYREGPMGNPLGFITPTLLGMHGADAFQRGTCGSIQVWMR